jgi:hypothetical protein
MKKINRSILGITLLIAMLLIPTALAFAKELGAMDVSGPGISGTLHIDNVDSIREIESSGFFDQSHRIAELSEDEIAKLGQGYEMAFFINGGEEGQFAYVFKLVYYPDPEGGKGYQHWVGEGESAVDITPSSIWTRASGGEDTFWSIMQANGVERTTAQESEPAVSAPSVVSEASADIAAVAQPAPAPAPLNWIGIAVALTLALILAAILVLRRRSAPQTVSTGGD